jgi:hypothetical protein
VGINPALPPISVDSWLEYKIGAITKKQTCCASRLSSEGDRYVKTANTQAKERGLENLWTDSAALKP